jgi:hypothetical protein
VNVYIANFGEQNYEWPVCLERSSIATMNDVEAQPLWEAGDREGYILSRMKGRTAAGLEPTRGVASRWFNLMTTIAESEGDIWIHSDGTFLWWTRSLPKPPEFIRKTEPVGRKRDVVVCHKPCEPWRKADESGRPLPWKGLHAKAKDFLSTEATLQKLSPDYAAYAAALVGGADLSEWHDRPIWTAKVRQSKSKSGPVKVFNSFEQAAYVMADAAFRTTATANGQTTERTAKIKNMGFGSKVELQQYLTEMLNSQEGVCELTGLQFNLDQQEGDPQLRASLDRIDSNGHYERGNLQIVCRFVNRWKGADADPEFRRLLDVLKAA